MQTVLKCLGLNSQPLSTAPRTAPIYIYADLVLQSVVE